LTYYTLWVCDASKCNKLENIGSRIDMQTHAGNGIAARVTSNRATVTVFVTV